MVLTLLLSAGSIELKPSPRAHTWVKQNTKIMQAVKIQKKQSPRWKSNRLLSDIKILS